MDELNDAFIQTTLLPDVLTVFLLQAVIRIFFCVMASGGIYSLIYITIYNP